MNIVKRGFNRNGCAMFVLYTVAGSSVSRTQGIHDDLGLFNLIAGDEGGTLIILTTYVHTRYVHIYFPSVWTLESSGDRFTRAGGKGHVRAVH